MTRFPFSTIDSYKLLLFCDEMSSRRRFSGAVQLYSVHVHSVHSAQYRIELFHLENENYFRMNDTVDAISQSIITNMYFVQKLH